MFGAQNLKYKINKVLKRLILRKPYEGVFINVDKC